MTTENTQAVATTTDAPAKPAAEVPGARDDGGDLDTLLSQFEQATKQPEPAAPAQKAEPATGAVDVEARRKLAEMEFERDFKPTLARVRGEVAQDILDDKELTHLIDGWAKDDPRLQKAWLNRAADPRAWSQVEAKLSERLAKKFQPRVDKNATDDTEAVAAAVRSASTKAPPDAPKKYGSLSNQELQAEIDKYV